MNMQGRSGFVRGQKDGGMRKHRRRELGIPRRRRIQGKRSGDNIREKGKLLQQEIRQEKRQTSEDFLNAAEGDNVWAVV
jgi:hypothetical protein